MTQAVSKGLVYPGDIPDGTSRVDRVRKISRGWINSIQFSEPHGSLEDMDSLLEDIKINYLRIPKEERGE